MPITVHFYVVWLHGFVSILFLHCTV